MTKSVPHPQHNAIHFSSVACETIQAKLKIKQNSLMLWIVTKGHFKGKLHPAMFRNNIVTIVLGSVGLKNLRIGFDLMMDMYVFIQKKSLILRYLNIFHEVSSWSF